MEKQEFIELLEEKSGKIQIKLNEEQLQKFYQYMNLLIEWNEKINLTAITNPEEIVLKHFIDSMTILRLTEENTKLLDIGTGAGFPGIPLKISNDKLEVILVDSLNKRVNFLSEVIGKLNLKKITAIHARAEELAKNKKYREQFDIVTSRAVAPLNVLLEYMLPFVKENGRCICMKGSDIQEELKESKQALNILGGKVENIIDFTLPDSDMKRNILIIKKVKKTPACYPRKAGTPKKLPII